MKQTSRINASREVQGSRPRTVSCPSNDVSPRIAFSAVVLPAPFGPISPRMRPSSTRRSIPLRATVVPKALRSPRASIVAMASAFLLSRGPRRGGIEFLLRQTEPLNGRRDARPFVGQKFFAFAFEQKVPRSRFHKHAETAPVLDQVLID